MKVQYPMGCPCLFKCKMMKKRENEDGANAYIDIQDDYCIRCLEKESQESLASEEAKPGKKNEIKSERKEGEG